MQRIRKLIDDYKMLSRNWGKKNPKKQMMKDKANYWANKFNEYPEHFITDNSPIFGAMKTGYMDLLPQQGGRHYLTVEEL